MKRTYLERKLFYKLFDRWVKDKRTMQVTSHVDAFLFLTDKYSFDVSNIKEIEL
jgi:hypothetical protein